MSMYTNQCDVSADDEQDRDFMADDYDDEWERMTSDPAYLAWVEQEAMLRGEAA